MDKFDTRIPSSAKSSSNAASCFFLSSRCTANNSDRPLRHRFFLRKGIRIVCQMISMKTLLPGQNYKSIRRINTIIVPSAIDWADYGAGACLALQSKNPVHLIGSGAEHL